MSKKTDSTIVDGEGPVEKKKLESKYNPTILRDCIQKKMDSSQIMGLWTVRVADARGSEPIVFAHQA